MGLNIENDLVDVDHNHNQLLSTGRHGNPVIQQVSKNYPQLTVYSTFRRHKAPNSIGRDREQRSRGDNCHLLYALKGKDGLRTTFGAIRRLMLHFDAILEDIVIQSGTYDAIIPMPSGYAISRIYAKRLARRYGCEVHEGIFEKITMDNAKRLLSISPLTSPEKRKIAARLSGTDFSLKNIPTKYREHFPPVVLLEHALPEGCQRFLLADDLLATGTTLLAARRLILESLPTASVDAACLFSAI
jgi:hypothetical protein